MADGWQPIETAPEGETVIIADEACETIAVAHCVGGWLLGTTAGSEGGGIDFDPHWWLPYSYKGNPFKLDPPNAQPQ